MCVIHWSGQALVLERMCEIEPLIFNCSECQDLFALKPCRCKTYQVQEQGLFKITLCANVHIRRRFYQIFTGRRQSWFVQDVELQSAGFSAAGLPLCSSTMSVTYRLQATEVAAASSGQKAASCRRRLGKTSARPTTRSDRAAYVQLQVCGRSEGNA